MLDLRSWEGSIVPLRFLPKKPNKVNRTERQLAVRWGDGLGIVSTGEELPPLWPRLFSFFKCQPTLRIGHRTARAGAEGDAFVLICPAEE